MSRPRYRRNRPAKAPFFHRHPLIGALAIVALLILAGFIPGTITL